MSLSIDFNGSWIRPYNKIRRKGCVPLSIMSFNDSVLDYIHFYFFQKFNRTKYLYRCYTIMPWGNMYDELQ